MEVRWGGRGRHEAVSSVCVGRRGCNLASVRRQCGVLWGVGSGGRGALKGVGGHGGGGGGALMAATVAHHKLVASICVDIAECHGSHVVTGD